MNDTMDPITERLGELCDAGRERGRAAGSWVLDGNSSAEAAARLVQGYEDGDPEVMDLCPSPLSGENAGESLSELGLADAEGEELDAYEMAFEEGFWDEVMRSARAMLD